MRIGELSRRTGISVRMLRYYETQGLLVPNRNHSGYRAYTTADERTVRRIQGLSSAGLTLQTIKHILPCVEGRSIRFIACADLRQLMENEAAKLDERIEDLVSSRNILKGFLQSIQ